MKKIRIGYFADGPWSHKALARLLADETIQVVFICARHDKPDKALRLVSKERKIEFFSHPKVNSIEFLNLVSKYNCDVFVSMSFNQIFKKTLIELPPLGIINCHAGKLPFYKGRNVLNWALINDEKDFGLTVHFIDEGIDTGDIILQRIYGISDTDDYSTLLSRAYEGCGAILYDAIKILQVGAVKITKQVDIDSIGSYCPARVSGDEILDWRQTSRDVFNFVRAICLPGPEARTYLSGKEVRINKVSFLAEATNYRGIPGCVVGVDEGGFLVKTLDSFVRVTEWSGYPRPKIGDRFN
jgi:methionyl-tRNA formyltransferase